MRVKVVVFQKLAENPKNNIVFENFMNTFPLLRRKTAEKKVWTQNGQNCF